MDSPSSRVLRVAAYSAAVVIVGAILATLLYLDGLGFPDGHVTELERFHRRVAYVLLPLGALWGFYHVYLGWSAGRRSRGRAIVLVLLVDGFLAVALWVANGITRGMMDHGQGG